MSEREVEATEEAAAARGAVRLRVPERRQMEMVVQCPDDLVPAQHPVRMVMALVERLDVSRFAEAIRAREGVAGRDATDPRLLVGLWLYACVRGIGAARELARRCEESAAFRWLCGGVTVNHRLLSDFSVDHARALDELFTQVIASLVDKELVRVSRVSQDGVGVRVSAGAGSFRREERLWKLLAESKEHVEELGRQLENPAAGAALSLRQRAARRRATAEKQQRLQQAIAAHPTRFAGFAALPTADPKAAADELERCVTKLGFKGAMIHGIAHGKFVDDKQFWPIYARAEALAEAPAFLAEADGVLRTIAVTELETALARG